MYPHHSLGNGESPKADAAPAAPTRSPAQASPFPVRLLPRTHPDGAAEAQDDLAELREILRRLLRSVLVGEGAAWSDSRTRRFPRPEWKTCPAEPDGGSREVREGDPRERLSGPYVRRVARPDLAVSARAALAASFPLCSAFGCAERGSVRLRDYADGQSRLRALWDDPGAREEVLGLLQDAGFLGPTPHLYWEESRPESLYERERLMVSVIRYLRAHAIPGVRQTLLELGPGSGRCKQEREQAAVACGWDDFALSSEICYPLDSVFRRVVDFDALERQCRHSLTEAERDQLCRLLHRVVLLDPGERGLQGYQDPNAASIAYDEGARAALRRDIDLLVPILERKAAAGAGVQTIPSQHSGRDAHGEVTYPRKESLDETVRAAAALIAREPARYFRERRRLLRFVPVHVPGDLIGDFAALDRLEDSQIDLAVEVRALIYLRGEAYVRGVVEMSRKLTERGLFIGDSVRCNDGWRYRIAELQRARRDIDPDMHLRVILGPPLPGEDYRQGEGERVPLAFVLTRDAAKLRWIAEHFPRAADGMPAAELVNLPDLAERRAYLSSLIDPRRRASAAAADHMVAF